MTSSFFTQIGSDIDGEAADDDSGSSVSLSADGSFVAIGAVLNDDNGSNSGHVRIYQNVNGVWTKVGDDIDGEAAQDYSGTSVSLSSDGSVVAIGAESNDDNGSNSGHVRIYQNFNGTWLQLGDEIDGEAADDRSGGSVSLSADGSVVAIGAYGNDGNGSYSGHVRIYQNVNNTWTKIGDDIDGEAVNNDSGKSVSLSADGSVVAISAPYNDGNGTNSGHVRIYTNVNGVWTKVGDDIDGEAAQDYSGTSVSLSSDGSVVAIGAESNDDNGSNSGHVRIYQNFNGTWLQLGDEIDGEAADDHSGGSVSLSADGSVVAIGAPYNDGTGSNSGHVRIYQYLNYNWIQLGTDIDGEAAGDFSGRSVSLSSDGSVVAIGAAGNDGNGDYSGHVRLYETGISTDPKITGPSGNAGASLSSVSINENQTTVYAFTANETVTWSLLDFLDSSRFLIDSATGALRFINAPDYESPVDLDENNSYILNIRATDAINNTSEQRLIVNVSDQTDEIAPLISGPSGSAGASVSSVFVNENQTTVHTFSANETVTWSLHNSFDSSQFSINTSTGVLSFGAAPDYEIPADSDGNNQYILDISATDTAGNRADQALTITVADIDETPALISGPSGSAGDATSTKSVAENSTAVHTFTANETVAWSLSGGADQALFDIDSSTGALSFQSAPDYENPTDSGTNNSYVVTVRATDGDSNTSDQTVTTTVTDLADETAPSITGPSGSAGDGTSTKSIGENSIAVHTFTANETVTWSLSGGVDQALFDIDTSTGALSFKSAPNYESPADSDSNNSYVVTIRATDASGNTSDQTLTTTVTDVSSTIWSQIGSDIDGETADDYSGHSVSLSSDGSVVAISAPYNNGNGSYSGHVRIYQDVSGTWTQVGSDIDGEVEGDYSGWSVSLSADGSIIAIGSEDNDGNGSNSGHVRIFQNVNNAWTQVGSDINGEDTADFSGHSVSLSSDGSVVAIGALYNDGENRSDSGHVRIYQNINNTWTQVGSDIDGEAEYDISGWSISLSSNGSVVAIGAHNNDGNGTNSGHVRIYQNVDGTWTKVGDDIDGEAEYDDSGWSVSLSADGSIVAIGAPYNDGVNGTYSGHVRIYKNVNNSWTQLGSDIDGEAAGDLSGRSVSLSADGSVVAIGARLNNGNGSSSGHVRIYQNVNNAWTQVGSDINGEDTADFSGHSVSLSSDGSVVAIGALYNDGENRSDSGHVRLYQIDLDTTTQLTELQALTYIASNPDLIAAFGTNTTAATDHYNNFGQAEGRSLDSFNVDLYLANYSDLSAAFGTNTTAATQHYINSGHTEGRTAGLTETTALSYIASNPDLINAFGTDTEAAIAHYSSNGQSEGRSFNSFSATNYLANYADLAAAFGSDTTAATRHYITSGYAEGRTAQRSGGSSIQSLSSAKVIDTLTEFETLNYIASHEDLITAFGTNSSAAEDHYNDFGEAEGRALDTFDEWGYLASNNDLLNAFGSDTTAAVEHYISFGISEGRGTNGFNASSYLNSYADLSNAFGDNQDLATKHYVEHGFNEGRSLVA